MTSTNLRSTVVDVGNEFHSRLANRDDNQGDGKFNAVEFRHRFLSDIDGQEAWQSSGPAVILDFRNVRKIGPSFANEAFAYFTQYARPNQILKKIQITNASPVQMAIIKQELESGYV